MRILVIEDEGPAAQKLLTEIRRISPGATVHGPLQSVKEVVTWMNSHPAPDLILADIQLRDGTSLEAFRQHPVPCPIIFTTAYDEYVLEVLEHNSIDYLLKPIRQEKLERALNKYLRLREHFTGNLGKVVEEYFGQREGDRKRSRLVVRKGSDFLSIPVDEIAFFRTEHKVVFVVDMAGGRHIVDGTLAEMESRLDPGLFFRVNRWFLVNIRAVKKFRSLEKGRIQLDLQPSPTEPVIVSQENAAEFRRWVGK